MKTPPREALKNRRHALLIAALFAICPPGAVADGPDDGVSREQLLEIIQRLEQRVESLEERLAAQPGQAPTPQADARELEQRVNEQERQISEQRQQIEALADAAEESGGSGWWDRTHIGGYGELHYNHLEAEDSANDLDQIDVHRFVLFFGHDFNDDIRFFSELELEHALAGESKPGEVELEQMFVEMDLFDDRAAARAGLFLIPVGILNETHEPNTFYGVERNAVENVIIPSTWWAGGAGYTQRFGEGFQFDIALHEGLAIPTTGSNAFRVRSGRQKTANATGEDFATTARLKYTGIPGLEVAATVQHQNDPSQSSNDGLDAGTLYEAHLAWQRGRFGFRGLYALWDFDIDEAVALANGVSQATIDRAEQQEGWYVEPSFRILDDVGLYARYSEIDGARIQDNFDESEIGINYWPHPSVVLKADYRMRDHEAQGAEARDFDGFDLGVGYQF